MLSQNMLLTLLISQSADGVKEVILGYGMLLFIIFITDRAEGWG